MKKGTLFAIVGIVALALGCTAQNESPMSPTSPGSVEPQIEAVPPASSGTQPSVEPNENLFSAEWLDVGLGKVGANISNNSVAEEWLGLACYSGPHDHPDQQSLPSYPSADRYWKIRKVKPGKDVNLEVLEPCGPYQCDVFHGIKQVLEIPFYGESLIRGIVGKGELNCEPPPPKPDPKCPSGLTFDIVLEELQTLVVVNPCPEYYFVTYELETNMVDKFDLDVPAECVSTGPTTGKCKLEPNKKYEFSGVGYFHPPTYDPELWLQCGSDLEIFYRECEPCVACVEFPQPYQREDGNVFLPSLPGPLYWLVDGSPAQTQVVVLDPECDEKESVEIELFDSTCGEPVKCGSWKFEKEGPPCLSCEDIDLDEGCYNGNIDTVAHFKSYFDIPEDICIVRTMHVGSKRTACILSPISAKWAVVKGGNGFRLYQDVEKWDLICTYCGGLVGGEPQCKRPDISHISFFDCCPED